MPRPEDRWFKFLFIAILVLVVAWVIYDLPNIIQRNEDAVEADREADRQARIDIDLMWKRCKSGLPAWPKDRYPAWWREEMPGCPPVQR
jgi:hypothetical protein